MDKRFWLVIVLSTFVIILANANPDDEDVPDDFYALSAIDIDGEEVSFEKYRGKVLVIANTASQCGHASYNFAGLLRMRDILDTVYKDRFEVLAFPSNQFGGQEPGTSEEIKYHIQVTLASEYDVFQKVDVIGGDAHPVFKFISSKVNQTPDWNFWKYLVDYKGNVLSAYGPTEDIQNVYEAAKAVIEEGMKVEGIEVAPDMKNVKIEL